MPYEIRGKCIYRSDTGKKVGCTKGEVKKYMAALHTNVNEATISDNDKPKSVTQLNAYLKGKYPKDIKVARGNGYFYIYSDDEETAYKIAGLYSSSVDGMWPIDAFSFKSWKQAIDDVLTDTQGGYGDNPVFENDIKLRSIFQNVLYETLDKKTKLNNASKEISNFGSSIEVFPDPLTLNDSYSIIRITSQNVEFNDRRTFEQFLTKLKSDKTIDDWKGPLRVGMSRDPDKSLGYTVFIDNFTSKYK